MTDSPKAATDDAAVDIATDYLDLWNDRQTDEIPGHVASTFRMHDPFAPKKGVAGPRGEVHGRDGLAAFMNGVDEGFPDFQVSVTHICPRNGTVLYAGRLELTHRGYYFGIPPSNRSAEVGYMGRITVSDGAVVRHWVYPPVLELAAQLRPGLPGMLLFPARFIWGQALRR